MIFYHAVVSGTAAVRFPVDDGGRSQAAALVHHPDDHADKRPNDNIKPDIKRFYKGKGPVRMNAQKGP